MPVTVHDSISKLCTSYKSCAGRGEPELPRCWISPRKWRTTPFSSSVCLRALASRTLTFGTGSDARLRRLGSKCSTNWSTGMHSSSTTAYETNTAEKARFVIKIHYLLFLSFLSTLPLIWPVKKALNKKTPPCVSPFWIQPKMGQQEQIIFFQECFRKCCSLAYHQPSFSLLTLNPCSSLLPK